MKTSSSYSWSDYAESLLDAVIPWIAFACLALLIFILAIIIRFIKAVCCKSKVKLRSDMIKNICVGFFFIVTFLSMGCCAYIIHYADSTYQSYMQLQCTSGRIPYGLLNGNLKENWLGLSRAHDDLNRLVDIIETNYTILTQVLWDDTNWLETAPNDFSNALNRYFNNYSDSKVASPNPLGSSNVELSYINNLGGPNKINTYTYAINTEYNTRIYSSYLVFSEFKAADIYSTTQIDTVIDGINSAQKSLDQFIKGNKEVNDNIESWIVDNRKDAKDGWRIFSLVHVLIGWFICVGTLVTISAQALNKPKLANGLCCYWVFAGLFSVFGFILCTALLSFGIVSNDSCGLIGSLMTPDGLKDYTVIVPDYIYEYMNICLNGDGDIDAVLGLNETFEDYAQLLKAEDYIYTQLGINSELEDFESISTNWEQIQDLWTYKDIVSGDDQDTPEYNLNEFNKFSDSSADGSYQSTCTTKTLDQWVFNSTQCSRKIVSPLDPLNQQGLSSCLIIPQWSTASLSSRYQNYLKCTYNNSLGGVYENILAYQSALSLFQASVNTLAGKLTGGLQQVNNTIVVSAQNLISQRNSIHSYYYSPDQLGEIYELVYGDEGLIGTLNCKFIRNYAKTLKKSVCDNCRESIYGVFIFVFVLSFLMILLEFSGLYLSRALLKPDESVLSSQITT